VIHLLGHEHPEANDHEDGAEHHCDLQPASMRVGLRCSIGCLRGHSHFRRRPGARHLQTSLAGPGRQVVAGKQRGAVIDLASFGVSAALKSDYVWAIRTRNGYRVCAPHVRITRVGRMLISIGNSVSTIPVAGYSSSPGYRVPKR
jgi:hypothetical protein